MHPRQRGCWQITARVEALELSLREHATGLLPIALAPNLLREVLKQLDLEQDVRFEVVDQVLCRHPADRLGYAVSVAVVDEGRRR
jgi:hypothetical protein